MIRVLFRTFLNNYHSYSIVSYHLLKHLLKKDNIKVYVDVVPFFKTSEYNEELLEYEVYTNQEYDIVFQCVFPYNYIKDNKPTLMFITNEYDTMNLDYYNLTINEMLNNKNLYFLTPSMKSKKAFLNTSKKFEKKTFVLKHGVDSINQHSIKTNNQQFTFLHVSALSANKNTHEIIKAFKQMNDNKCKLIIKCNKDIYNIPDYIKNERNIQIINEPYTFTQMKELYSSIDCYISAGEYEAFDIPIIETSSYCKPVIINSKSPQNNVISKKNQFKSFDELPILMNKAMNNELDICHLDNSYLNVNIANEFTNILKIFLLTKYK